MNRAYRVALACGVLPLLVGVSIFLLWVSTGWQWLVVAGIVTLCGGVAIFLVGIIALTWYCWLALHTLDISKRRTWLSTFACAGLLLSNFPVAGGIIVAAIAIETRYTVVVHNTLQQPLDDVRVFGGGCEVTFGAISPGGVVRRSFWIHQDGTLEFRAVSNATTYAQTIDGYVTNGMGGYTTVTVKPDGTVSVCNGSNP
ncbi:MAG: hypothetical protein ACWGMZ_09715 [Thermoguttaceae bacterium]